MTEQAGRITGSVMNIEGINHWPEYQRFRGQFAEAMDERTHNIEWLDSQIHNNIFRLWSNETSAIIAKIEHYPTGALEVHGMLAAGEIEGIVELIPFAEEWGRSIGAIIGCISSHPAWGKIMKKHGYEPSQMVLRKDL